MNFKISKRKLLIGLIISGVILFILGYIISNNIKEIVNIIIISFVLSYTLMPIRDMLSEKLRLSKRMSALLVILFLAAIVITSMTVLIPDLFDEMNNMDNIMEKVMAYIDDLNNKLKINEIPIAKSLYYEMLEKGEEIVKEFSVSALENVISVGNNIISFAVCPIIIYYFLADGKNIYNHMLLIVPARRRKITKEIINDIDGILSKYIISQLFLCLIIGVLTFILLIVLKVKYPIWISLINAIFNIIPYFGPIFGMIPAIIVAIIDSPIKCLWVVIGMLFIQQIEGNILSPKITGDSTDMHPFVIILLLLIGDKIGGFIGMILVIPIAVIAKVLYDDINYYLF